MTTQTFSQTSLEVINNMPPAKRGPGFRTVSVMSYSSSSTSSGESVEVPADLESRELLEFLGFREPIIEVIWQSWQTRDRSPYSIQDTLFERALYYIEDKSKQYDALDENDNWDDALEELGLCQDLRRRILNPAFDSVRCTECACYWAKDTLIEAYDFLRTLSPRIDKKRSQQISRVNSPDDAILPQPAIRFGQPQRRGSSAGGRGHGRGQALPPTAQPLSTPPSVVQDRTLFFKGGSMSRLAPAIRDDSTIRIGALSSTAPTDFHPEASTYLYLTKYRDTAVIYAEYVHNRVGSIDPAILTIAIPKSLLSDAVEIYGEAWGDIVWNSRNTSLFAETFRQLPASLKRFENAPILIGPVCHNPTDKISQMRSKAELGELRRPGSTIASQHVIQSIARQREIAAACQNFVWVTPHVPRQRQQD